MGQNDKFGPKGRSVEADIRKNVLNAKIEAFNNKHITHLESLDGSRKISPGSGKYFSALDIDKMPREYTYITKESAKGGSPRYFRTIIMMETKAESKMGSGVRRPDFIQVKYELSKKELRLIKRGESFSKVKQKFAHIHTKYMEIRSIDFNTPLHVKGAARHFAKHVDTFYSSLNHLTERHKIFATSHNAIVNVVVKEWYHKSTSWWDKFVKKKFKDTKIRGLAFFESHTAVFTMKSTGGGFKPIKAKVESILRDRTRDPKNPRKLKFLSLRNVLKITGKDLGANPTGKVPEKLKIFGKEISTLKKLLPSLIRLK